MGSDKQRGHEYSTRDNLIAEMRENFNHIGIVGDTDLVRLVGYHEDLVDCYYHVLYTNSPARQVKSSYFTAVGSFCSLNGKIPEDRYNALEQTFSLNGAPPAPEFLVTITNDDWSFDEAFAALASKADQMATSVTGAPAVNA